MKVLHLATHLNHGGITRYIFNLVEPISTYGVETLVLSSGGAFADHFRNKGVKVFEFPIRTKSELSPKLYAVLPRIKRLIEQEGVDLLHAHTRITQVMAYWLSRMTGIPVVTTYHGFYKRRLGRRILPAWGDRAVAISQSVGDHLIRDFKMPPKKLRVIENGVDFAAIEQISRTVDPRAVRQSYGFGPEDPVIGSIARLVEDKGHEYLIRAMARVRKQVPNARALIVGDGRHRFRLGELVRKLGLTDHVRFTGNVDDVITPLCAFDLFTLPATWREGFGLSIVEAMACGKPIIVTNIWALNTLVINRETGILVEPKEVEPLSRAIVELLTDRGLAEAIGGRGREMAENRFSLTRMAREMAEVYGEMVPQTLTLT